VRAGREVLAIANVRTARVVEARTFGPIAGAARSVIVGARRCRIRTVTRWSFRWIRRDPNAQKDDFPICRSTRTVGDDRPTKFNHPTGGASG